MLANCKDPASPLGAVLAGLTTLALVLVAGCSSNPGPANPNLLLITLDTTRADRLGCYAHPSARTPNLDRLAAEGALVDRAITVAPVTLPSHASILTGLYPPQHGVRDNADFRLPDRVLTLAEHLGAQGYSTGAVVAAYVLSADFGLVQGFERYDEPPRPGPTILGGNNLQHQPILERPADEVTDAALAWPGTTNAAPFFLWVHYFDPHREYEAPARFAERFPDAPYDAEIAFLDEQIGRLLGTMRERGLLEDTLIAVVGDHGESLGQHGEETHGLFVYDATIRVPLILHHAGNVPAGTQVDRLVSVIDLAPTLLALMELPPLPHAAGESFAEAARGRPVADRAAVYSEARLPLRSYGWAPLATLQDGDAKFIEAPFPELYDLTEDPSEERNLSADRPALVASWRQRLDEMRAGWRDLDLDATRVLGREQRRRLAALGYLSSPTAAVSHDAAAELPDPKRRVELHNQLLAVQARVAAGELPAARALLEPVLRADPDNPAALGLSGTLLCTTEQCEEGLDRLLRAAERSPGVYEIQRNLANALHLAGRLDQAETAWRAAIEIHPFTGEDRYALGNVLFAAGDVSGALEAYEAAGQLGFDSAGLRAARGVALAAAGETDDAYAALKAAVQSDPELADAWKQLGSLAEERGDLDAAIDHYAEALALRPNHPAALLDYARTCLHGGNAGDALRAARQFLAIRPEHPLGRLIEAQALAAGGHAEQARVVLRDILASPELDPRVRDTARDLLAALQRDER